MITKHRVKKTNVIELLNDIDDFILSFDKFKQKHPSYSYTLNIEKENKEWMVNVIIEKDETIKNKFT